MRCACCRRLCTTKRPSCNIDQFRSKTFFTHLLEGVKPCNQVLAHALCMLLQALLLQDMKNRRSRSPRGGAATIGVEVLHAICESACKFR